MKDEKKIYFNKHEFLKINDLTKTNPYLAKELFENYLINYPRDYSAYTYYAALLINLREFVKAEQILNSVLSALDNNHSFPEDKVYLLKRNIIFNQLRLLGYQERKEELLDLYFNHYFDMRHIGNEVDFYYRKLAGKLDLTKRNQHSYILRQIIEYHEEDFRDHIKKHLAEYNQNDARISKTYFSYDFPIDKIIDEIKKIIPSENKLCIGFFEDVYVFKYDACGRDTNRLVDYFKVITFQNTDHFITMCPSDDCENLPFTDLNYLKEEKEEKVKKLSQIEKFKKRYHQM